MSCSAGNLTRVGTEILLHLATEIFGDLVTNNIAGTGNEGDSRKNRVKWKHGVSDS